MAWGMNPRVEAYLAVAQMNTEGDLRAARVSARHRGVAEVVDPENSQTTTINLARPHRATHEDAWPPVVGDWVAIEREEIVAILPRATYLERGSVQAASTMQPMAANVDLILLVDGLYPTPSQGWAERIAALGAESGIPVWAVLTKEDLVTPDEAARAAARIAPLVDRLFTVVATDHATLTDLMGSLSPDQTIALIGHSGVGKSTLTNALTGTQLATGEVRSADGKGRHTTTTRQLVAGEHALILDTPGLRQLASTATLDSLDEVFPRLAELAASCRFADCSHSGEPGCAVAQALDEGLIDTDELTRYRRMRAESQRHAHRSNARLKRANERKQSKENTRGRRGAMALKGRTN
ncbi:MAG: ribosome small subunit-dependent GTPase A [Actinomycetaceae bacterium]|nr:ribosome small subunit-dependent GTPase A [Actinomycetaceae bacterium]